MVSTLKLCLNQIKYKPNLFINFKLSIMSTTCCPFPNFQLVIYYMPVVEY